MKNYQTVTVEVNDPVTDIEYEVTAEVTLYTDKNYGADRDGNRGWSVTEIDDFKIIDVVNTETDESVNFEDTDISEDEVFEKLQEIPFLSEFLYEID